MRAPQLGRAQSAAASTCKPTRKKFVDKGVGHIRGHQIQQAMGASRRKNIRHVGTLTDPSHPDNLPISAKTVSYQAFAKTFGTPSNNALLSFFCGKGGEVIK